ncbi:unnamed protein product [Soboliphyme baturini]|uniref:Uncharacterized protein n=1 Tax=Soboliphyme baturini TaxID=241478 RepID=A0A183ICK6_9BILA|nr:unnamed protein product [Soboliphyme baturini]
MPKLPHKSGDSRSGKQSNARRFAGAESTPHTAKCKQRYKLDEFAVGALRVADHRPPTDLMSCGGIRERKETETANVLSLSRRCLKRQEEVLRLVWSLPLPSTGITPAEPTNIADGSAGQSLIRPFETR